MRGISQFTGDLLERNAEEKIIIRREDRDITIDEEHSMRIEMIDFGIEHASFLVTELPPMSETSGEWWTHEFGEVGTVINGELTIDIDGEVFELKTGDSVYVKAHTRHCYYIAGDDRHLRICTAVISAVSCGVCDTLYLGNYVYSDILECTRKGNPFPGEF